MLGRRILTHLSFRLHNLSVPTVDLSRYLNQQAGWQEDCRKLTETIRDYGVLYIKDPRANYDYNSTWLDFMEGYFDKRSKQLRAGEKGIDTEESPMPLGLCDEYNERVKDYVEEKRRLKHPHLSETPIPALKDAVYRFHWRMGFENNIVPKDFANFAQVMNTWGSSEKQTGLTVSEMLAVGLGLQRNALRRTIENGMLYLSPPALNLDNFKPGDVITSFHQDFDLVTVHGKTRFPGLYTWLNNGQKFKVRVPDGHFLVHGGKQLQWLTGGYIKANFHQVVHNQDTETAKQAAIKQGRSLWRIASTLFCHVEGTQSLKPFDKFRSEEVDRLYPDITADEYLLQELSAFDRE